MINRIRWALFATLVSVSLVGGPVAAHADSDGGGGDNVVIVHNQTDGATRARSQTATGINPTDTVANQNYAEATSSCTGCRTVAAAIQVVLVTGSPSTFVPANAAVAVNEDCQFCQTFAYAHQYVITTDGDAILSDDARAQIRDLDGQVAALVESDEPFAQLYDDLDSLAAQIDAVAVNDLQGAGRQAAVEDHRDVKEQDSPD